MEKKGYLPFKKYIILIIIIIAIFYLYPKLSSLNSFIKTSSSSCKDVIPNSLKLDCNFDLWNGCRVPDGSTWADGTPMYFYEIGFFQKGNLEGENINYLYAGGFSTDYYKKEVNLDGTIGKEIHHSIRLGVDPAQNYKVVYYKCK